MEEKELGEISIYRIGIGRKRHISKNRFLKC